MNDVRNQFAYPPDKRLAVPRDHNVETRRNNALRHEQQRRAGMVADCPACLLVNGLTGMTAAQYDAHLVPDNLLDRPSTDDGSR